MTPQWVTVGMSPSCSYLLTFPPPLFNSPLSFTLESGIIYQINTYAHILALGFAFEVTRTKTGSSESPQDSQEATEPETVLRVIHRTASLAMPLLPPLGHTCVLGTGCSH